jgi:four helix bundle protein
VERVLPSVPAMAKNVIATNHKELVVWQLCSRLRALTLEHTRRAYGDFHWRGQIRSSIRSACNNTTEGFYRKRDGDFLNHLIFAVASLGEFNDQLDEGLQSGVFTKEQYEEMRRLLIRAWKANSALRRYLAKSIEREKERKRAARRT